MGLSSIRRRLLVAFALPVAVLAVISGMRVSEANSRSDEVRTETSAALAAGGPTTFITSLMDERNIFAVELLDLQDAVNLRVDNSRQAITGTDGSLSELRDYLSNVEPETRATYEGTLTSVETGVKEARALARSYTGQRNPENLFADRVYTAYTVEIAKLHAANNDNIATIDDAELRNRARAVANLSATSDRQSQMARFALLSSLNHGNPAESQADAAQMLAMWNHLRFEAVAMLSADPQHQTIVADFYGRPNQERFESLVESFTVTGDADPRAIITEAADEAHPNAADAWNAARTSITDRAAEMTAAADARRREAVTWFLLAIAASLIVALASARSLSTPLLRLASQARHLATSHLPAAVDAVLATPQGDEVQVPSPVPVERSGITEIDHVVDALNEVQTRTLDLAVGQAVMRHNSADSLVNVARRVQGLVGRQIELIETVEHDEVDPDRLDTVYRLDHLAARIRRNSDSLVVLAGSQVRRRTNFGPPVSVIDVVRAATAEVEQYERVNLDAVQGARLSGQASADVAHIVAELAENGLAFSPPTVDVTISGYAFPSGDYQLAVSDSGIGMAPAAIDAANQCLAGTVDFGGQPTKYIGHHVVGRLAALHDIDVSIAANGAGGITATITVPAALITNIDSTHVDLSAIGTSPYEDLAGSHHSLHDVVAGRRSLDTLVR